jgi:hypothetical protein
VVGRERAQRRGATGKGDEPDPVAGQLAHHLLDLDLGAGQAVGRRVLGEHRLRDVEDDHHVGRYPRRGHGDRLAAALRPHEREHAGDQGDREQDQAGRDAGAARPRCQPALHDRGQELAEGTAGADLEDDEQGDDGDDHPDQVDEAEVREGHGSLRRIEPRRRKASTARPRPAATNQP